jgi:hypothetical protein
MLPAQSSLSITLAAGRLLMYVLRPARHRAFVVQRNQGRRHEK